MAKKTLVNPTPETTTTEVATQPAGTVAVQPTAAQTPYVVFANRKAEKWDEYKALFNDLKEGEPVLVRPSPLTPVRLTPFRFALVQGEHIWTQNETSSPYAATLASLTERRGDDWTECYEAVILIDFNGKFTPARVSARRALVGAFKTAAQMLASDGDTPPLVNQEEWFARSPAHRATGKVKTLAARVLNKVTTGSATAKSTGNLYFFAKSTQEPATADESAAIEAALETPAMKAVAEAYWKRVGELRALVK